MISILRRFLMDQRAVTIIEYSLIVCLISIVTIGAMTSVGKAILSRLLPVLNTL